MKKIIAGIVLFVLGAGSSKVNAHLPGCSHKQVCEQKRIYQGVRTGTLTPNELVMLERQQAKIHHHKRFAKADGIVTRKEFKHIKKEEARASRNICRQKHDGENRF